MEKAHPQQEYTIFFFETPISTLKHVKEAPGWLLYFIYDAVAKS